MVDQKNSFLTRNFLLFIVLGLAFFLRIYKANSPLIGMHAWRQADTAAMSRNYYENGYHFLYPQIDWGGDSPGYVESEFPGYSFLVALFYKIFGVSEFIGRFLSIIFSLLTIYTLYLVVLKWIDQKTAVWTVFFFSVLPPNIFYSRTFQPESALLLSLVLGVYLFSQWTDSGKWKYFFLSAIFIALACLLKIPSFYIGLPLLYLAWQKFGGKTLTRWHLWLYALCVTAPVALWYVHAHRLYLKSGLTFGIWGYGSDKWGNWSLVLTWKFWDKILFRNIAEDYLTWIGFILFGIGLWLKRTTRKEKVFDFWMVSLVIYFIIVAQGNFVHLYYQLPFTIPACVFLAKVYSRYWTRNSFGNKKSIWLTAGLIGILALSAGRYHLYMQKENIQSSDVLKLAEAVQHHVKTGDLVIAVDNNDPTLLYVSHRKGWHATPEQIDDSFLTEKRMRGAKYIIGIYAIFKNAAGQNALRFLSIQYPCIFSDKKSFIFKLAGR